MATREASLVGTLTQLLPRSLFSNFGITASEARLPERLRLLIVRSEAESERLIGFAQLIVVATFAALFLLAPRPADAGMNMYEPVPIALAAYALFTVGRLILSYLDYMPGWLLVLSILLDMVLLIGLIWSFHVQYGQPQSFSLKIPTFLYIFVFIALRALRFDPRFVLTAGLAAASGWLAFVALTVDASPPGTITRNFVTYLTSNSILLGAEFDKVFTILLVTAILTFAVWRGRRMLVTAVKGEAANREISRFLSSGLAEAISSSAETIEAGQAAERRAAIIMLDIRGFTRFSTSVPPKVVVEMLTSFHARVVPIIQRNGGVVDKFLGDGVMATFGALQASETAVADGLRALTEVMEEAERWQAELGGETGAAPLLVNGAMAAGDVVFATLGSAERLEYTVIGEAVNLAAKLEKHNKVEGTRALTTRETYRLAAEQGYLDARAEPQVRTACAVGGVGQPIDLVVIA